MFNRKNISKLWLDYLNASSFKEIHGEARYLEYISRIKASAKDPGPLTPWPTVCPISEILETLIDQAYNEAIQGDDTSFEKVKKRLMQNVKMQEETNLLLFIHSAGVRPRGGQEVVLQEVRTRLKEKMKNAEQVREFYQTWTEPGARVVPELALYLKLYKGQKQGKSLKALQDVALIFSKKIKSGRTTDEAYMSESQISRSISIAKKIIKNVEKGNFPGKYKPLS